MNVARIVALLLAFTASSGLVGVATASTLNVHDEARMKLTTSSGEDLVEAGQAKGTVPGTVKARLTVGSNVIVSFTIYIRGGGSISGHGSAAIHTNGAYATFAGTVNIVRGSGRYSHSHGSAQVYGAINRETLNATVQVIGKIQR